ncbi:hypothetical protein AB0J35_34320 [Nonomuraea angiospora]
MAIIDIDLPGTDGLTAAADELIDAIRRVARGEQLIDTVLP